MKSICLGEKANQKSSHEPVIGRAGASVFASFKPETEKPSAQDPERVARFSHHFTEIDILPRPVVQPKLVVGSPGDKYEQEADRVAERFIGMQKPCPKCLIGSEKNKNALWLKSIDNQISHLPQREGKKGATQIGKVDRQAFQLSPQFETEIRSSRGGGQPLQKSAHNILEPWFGRDLSDVRIHTDFRSSEVAKSVNAIAFTTGQDVFFSRGSYDPESNKGLRLIAHELTHVLQQTDGRHPLKKTDDLILQRTPAGDLIDEHTSRGNLGEISLGRILSQRAMQGDYDIVDQVLNELGSTNRDDVSYELIRQTNDAHLRQFAQSFPGRRMLDRLYDELSSGSFSEEERRQANRIIDVRQTAIRPSERSQSLAGMKIFPFKLPGLTVFEDSPIMAERRPSGRIRVELPNRVFSYERYRAETRTLPIDVFISGIELPENETIGVRMYDLGGVLHVRPAIYLVQLANESTTRVFVTAGEAAALGLTMGSGALAAGVARGSTAVRALVRLGFSAERAANVVVWVDRAAFSIGLITTAIRDHRGWIIQRFGDSGRQFLDYVDFVHRAVAIYGIARCAIELSGLIANFRSAIASWRRSPTQSDTSLNATQRQALNTINRNTDEFLENVDQIQGASNRPPPLATRTETNSPASTTAIPAGASVVTNVRSFRFASSQVWSFSGRRIVVLETSEGRQAFYLRTGLGPGRPIGHAGAQAGEWAPFDGFIPDGIFEKSRYFRVDSNNPLYSFGSQEFREASYWLSQQTLPEALQMTEWRTIQLELQRLGARVTVRTD